VKGRWTLASPIAGRVLKVHQESGGPIAAGQPILEIGDTTQLEALVDLLSGDALRVPLGAPVRLSFGQSLPGMTGRVSRVEPVAFTKVSALGIEEQRVNLVVGIDPGSVGLPGAGDGFRVEATITIRRQESALMVPLAALVRIGSNWSAWVVRDGRAYPVEVDARPLARYRMDRLRAERAAQQVCCCIRAARFARASASRHAPGRQCVPDQRFGCAEITWPTCQGRGRCAWACLTALRRALSSSGIGEVRRCSMFTCTDSDS
jgi:hypothetical protein